MTFHSSGKSLDDARHPGEPCTCGEGVMTTDRHNVLARAHMFTLLVETFIRCEPYEREAPDVESYPSGQLTLTGSVHRRGCCPEVGRFLMLRTAGCWVIAQTAIDHKGIVVQLVLHSPYPVGEPRTAEQGGQHAHYVIRFAHAAASHV